ncbi:aldo/keto reductase [Streptomyces cinnabarinus]|uniref:Aldo/keto reductase n=1 Tax=Streptomyces cinnabarinus TaxID=67287 RepID=A0ABY7K411_9ACTN|nr:aldo/keto reductase [Streptomyces cinnabarinus]WAZ19074.1 aldo/keto reductase [Streptomyces cinnabarinus]
MHRPEEEDTDFDETLGTLSDLVRQGKVRYLGTSTFPPSRIVEGQWTAEKRGRERVVPEQPPYSILTRGVEAEVLPVAQRYGLAVIPWSPLAGGWLTGRYRTGRPQPESSRAARQPGRFDVDSAESAAKLEAVEALAVLAEQAGITLIELALNFVLAHPAVTAPIIGPRTLSQLEEQLGAADSPLPPDVLDEIDKIVPPGTTLSARDAGYVPPGLHDTTARRRIGN